jgi:hypothetical protein
MRGHADGMTNRCISRVARKKDVTNKDFINCGCSVPKILHRSRYLSIMARRSLSDSVVVCSPEAARLQCEYTPAAASCTERGKRGL